MAGRKNRIVQPGDGEAVQMGLFSVENTGDYRKLEDYPPVYRDEEGFRRVVAGVTDLCGLDFEFNTKTLRPTVIGVSNDTECAAVWYTKEILEFLEAERKARGFRYSGHAVLTADRQVLEAQVGETTLEDWSDSILSFWLANADLCKAPGKEEDADGGLGFMGLGVMASLTTDLPHHKTCRGRNCEELICPRHDVRGYCAIDAYVGLIGDRVSRAQAASYGVTPDALTFMHELQELAKKMQDLGIAADREYIATLAGAMEEEQAKLFPVKGEEGYVFNPRSPKEVGEWFREHKVFITSADKDSIQTALEKRAAECGFTAERFEDLRELLERSENLDPVLEVLFRLYTYKVLGKGTDSWFHQRYFSADGLLHPRFVCTGTSTGRFSSSAPNFQNCPKRGWGKRVRKAIVPRDKGNVIVEADFSQLELRIILYLAGIDQSVIGEDAFSWLVTKSGGLFDKAAQRFGGKPRDIAKSVSHGCLTPGHDVLTPSGWVPIEKWNGQEIAVYDAECKSVKFEVPAKYHVYDVEDAGMYKLRGTSLSADVTEDHAFPVGITGTWNEIVYDKWQRKTVSQFTNSGRVAVAGELEAPGIPFSETEIRRAVAIQADGSYTYSGVRFHFHKERKVERAKWLFGIPATSCYCKKGGWVLNWPHRTELLNDDKSFNWSLLLQMSQEQREWFIDELTYWDGTVKGSRKEYINSKKQDVDFVQTICHLSGVQGLVRNSGKGGFETSTKDIYKLSINRRSAAAIQSLKIEPFRYTGKVYCFTTSTGYFMIRHNDRVSMTGNSNYMEGLRLISPAELNYSRVRSEYEAGALRIYHPDYNSNISKPWMFGGKVVTFTGSNLAQRLFGSKTLENRKKALEIQEDIYFGAFGEIREFQQRATQESEARGYVLAPTGRFLRLNDTPEKNAKLIVAFLGQGVGAAHVQSIMLQFYRRHKQVFMMTLHDALVGEFRKADGYEFIYSRMKEMEEETPLLPGFTGPVKVEVGENWGAMEGLFRHDGKLYIGDEKKQSEWREVN